MRNRSRVLLSIFVLAAITVTVPVSGTVLDDGAVSFQEREAAYRHNNVGVAYLEQFEPAKAAEAFRRALAADSSIKIAQINLALALFYQQEIPSAREAAEKAVSVAPEYLHTHYLTGLIARNENRIEDALTAFQKVLASDPTDVGSNVNIGQIYLQQRKYDQAVTVLRKAYVQEPYNSTAIYNLATALIRTDARDEGQKLIERFQELRQSGAATALGQNYLEQGRYAEAIVSTGAEPELVDIVGVPLKFVENKPTVSTGVSTSTLIDFDNDGDPDLIAVNARSRRNLWKNDAGNFLSVASPGLQQPSTLKVAGILAGDVNNDTFEDLIFFGTGRPEYRTGDGKGGFKASAFPPISGSFRSGALSDVDHDGDLDVILLGSSVIKLLRNNGDDTFTDITEAAKLLAGPRPVAVIPTDFDNRRDIDLFIVNSGERPRLFQNLRDGSFRDVAGDVGLDRAAKWTAAAAGDVNKDGYTDFFLGVENGPGVFALSNGTGRYLFSDGPSTTTGATSAQFADLDNDGLLDLLVGTSRGMVAARNIGTRWAAFPGTVPGTVGRPTAADLNGDGRLDILVSDSTKAPIILQNDSPTSNRSFSVDLKGRVSNRTGVGSKVDMRSGSLAQKLESYAASPSPAAWGLHFGLGRRERPDSVRIIWPSGVIQAELDSGATAKSSLVTIEELDRKPSSCPYLYTWNGSEFEFVTDFLGGGEMGNWKDHGVYHFPDSDEFVRIPGEKLRPKDGRYELRVTNELEEVLFLDHLKLVAIDHAEGTEVYPNEGYGIPNAGKQIIYSTRGEQPPLSALDAKGGNVLPKINALDRTFYDSFDSLSVRGYAEPHTLTMTLDQKKGHRARTLLLLTGWTDYAFSSDNLAASQSGKRLFFPKLQVRNKRGEWQTVIESIGISVGRPQTVVADLTGKFLTDSREVRIVTNVKTYWDKIAVDTSDQSTFTTTELAPVQADLRERGFSKEASFSGMIVPAYGSVLNDGRWKYFTGRFTRTGDVIPLLGTTDNVFVISKTGDEIVLAFDALPDPRKGMKRTFLLYADGYSKEMDINSGSPDAVHPLPFKGMTRYPYKAPERFPMTEEKQRIYDEYTTRVGRRALPQVEVGLLR